MLAPWPPARPFLHSSLEGREQRPACIGEAPFAGRANLGPARSAPRPLLARAAAPRDAPLPVGSVLPTSAGSSLRRSGSFEQGTPRTPSPSSRPPEPGRGTEARPGSADGCHSSRQAARPARAEPLQLPLSGKRRNPFWSWPLPEGSAAAMQPSTARRRASATPWGGWASGSTN